MSTDKSHIEELRKYLKGEMKPSEAHAFEQKSLDDPFLQEAIEGAESIEAGAFISDVEALEEKLKLSGSSSIRGYWRIAAVISLVIIGGFSVQYLLREIDEPALAKDQSTEQTPAPSETIPPSMDSIANKTVAQVRELPVSGPPEEKAESSVNTVTRRSSQPVAMMEITEEPESEISEMSGLAREEDASGEIYDFVDTSKEGAAQTSKQEWVEEDKTSRSKSKKSAIADQANFSISQSSGASGVPISEILTGRVTNEFGDPMPQVTVTIKGTTQGTSTDAGGYYLLSPIYENTILTFSSLDMYEEEVVVGNRRIVNIRLQSSIESMQEVVVTGYGAYDNNPEGFVEAVPVGGLVLFEKYLIENLFYPEEAIGKGIEGRVVLQLRISPIGTIYDLEVKRSLGFGCDEEAIRLIKEGPNWNPATREGINVETRIRVRVNFEMK